MVHDLYILKFCDFEFCLIIQVLLCWQVLYFEKLLAFLVKLLCLLGFVEPTGPNSSLANISLLVEIWLCSNFYHSQEKGDYLVRIITSFRKLPKSFQKPRYIFIFLLPNYCIEKPPSFTNILSRN